MTGRLTHHALNDFHRLLMKSKNLVVITGAGVSAESGIPTFRDGDGKWRKEKTITDFATYNSFRTDPASLWEFYHYRRELVLSKTPNAAHYAIAKCEKWFNDTGRDFLLITQNVDGLHLRAGSKNVLQMHGSLFETKCIKCQNIEKNFDSPICEALRGKEKLVNTAFTKSDITENELPHCKKCGGLLRPNIVWFNEELNRNNIHKAWAALDVTDLTLIVGTSSLVFPVACFGTHVAERGTPVAEFNVKKGPYTDSFSFFFQGPASEILPGALDPECQERQPESSSS